MATAPQLPTCPPVIVTTQRFSRSGVGFLWNKRSELDPGQVSIINSLYNNRKKGNLECVQTITYKLGRSKAAQLGYGRYIGSKGSLETLERECRGTICKDYYHDIDVVNAHPVILSQYARRYYQKDLPENDYYIANRDKVLRSISENRDEAKQELIRILYGGTNRHEITAKLSAEIRNFSKFLSQQPEHAKLFAAVKHEDNVYGSFLSWILQTEERSIMLSMKKSLEDQGWSVDVLAYDGVMIRKREGYDINEAMRTTEKTIKADTGYDISLVSKNFDYYEVPTVNEEITPGVSRQMYEDMKAEFEKDHFYYVPSNQYVEVRPNGELIYMDTSHAINYLGTNEKYIFKISEKFNDYVQFLPFWMKDPERKTIQKIDMKTSDDPLVFSPPLAWAWKTAESPDDSKVYVDMFLNFINTLIPDQQSRQTLLEWLAHLLQRPFENPKSAMFLMGEKGCGKDTLFDFIQQFVVGFSLAVNYDDNEQFWSPHDTGRLNKLLVKLEEANGPYMRKYYSKLKAIITSDNSMFNPKGVKEIHAANYNRFVFTANPEDGQLPTETGERRFTIISCSPAMIGKLDEVFRPLRKTLFTPEGGRAIADYLLAFECGVWPRVLAASELQTLLAESQQSPEDRFVKEWDGEEVSATELYYKYRSFCTENELPRYSQSSMSFSKKLIRHITSGTIKRRMLEGKNLYSK